MIEQFKRGDLIVVVDNSRYHSEVPIGAIGVVRDMYSTRVTVRFEDIHNPRSQYDCFYFNTRQIKLYKGDTTMEGNYSIATIKFLDGTNTDKTYRYALYDDNVGIGDICVVKSAHHGLGIARIVDLEPKTDEKLVREVVCKCDFSAYEAREETRKRKAELKRKMTARAAQLHELAVFKMMAAEDPAMAELMKEFEGLEVC